FPETLLRHTRNGCDASGIEVRVRWRYLEIFGNQQSFVRVLVQLMIDELDNAEVNRAWHDRLGQFLQRSNLLFIENLERQLLRPGLAGRQQRRYTADFECQAEQRALQRAIHDRSS